MLSALFEIWGCLHELNSSTYECPNDISNASSTWVGLILGLILGGVITWWVYYRQKKIAEKQDYVLAHMVKLERRMVDMEKNVLEKILSLERKFDSSPERK